MLDVRLIDAGFRYPDQEKWIFRHLDLAIVAGEAIRVVGRNGAGKSTLLRVVSGLLDLTEGELSLSRRAKTAYMHQFSGEMLAGDLTIAEQIKASTDRNSALSQPPVDALAQFGLGLHHRLRSFIGHLSGGERQVIALLCTLAAGARVLCLDEFASALDMTSAGVADALLTGTRSESDLTLLVVSHSGVTIEIDREVALSN